MTWIQDRDYLFKRAQAIYPSLIANLDFWRGTEAAHGFTLNTGYEELVIAVEFFPKGLGPRSLVSPGSAVLRVKLQSGLNTVMDLRFTGHSANTVEALLEAIRRDLLDITQQVQRDMAAVEAALGGE